MIVDMEKNTVTMDVNQLSSLCGLACSIKCYLDRLEEQVKLPESLVLDAMKRLMREAVEKAWEIEEDFSRATPQGVELFLLT